MEIEKDQPPAREMTAGPRSVGVWRQRRRRYSTGLNVLLMVVLAGIVAGMVNFAAYRYFDIRWNLGGRRSYELSEKTRSLLGSLRSPVMVVAFFQRSHPQYEEIRKLLRAYEYEAARLDVDLRVEFVDPDRDLARARDLARKYDVGEANVLVFACEGRKKQVTSEDLLDYEIRLEGARATKRLLQFKGEQAFSSAIHGVTQETTPVVYVLAGHGEREVRDSSKQRGLSRLAGLIRNENVELRGLQLAEHRGVPQDCSALAIAGPDRRLSLAEVDMIADYLNRNGRVLALLDPAVTTGLEELLGKWGVRLSEGVVVGLTLSGRDLVVSEYGDHPITRNFRNVTTMFWLPRSVEPSEAPVGNKDGASDKPRVTPLAYCSAGGWEEMNLQQSPAQFDKEQDRRGPISIAVAVEKGVRGGIDVEVRPTRMVVVGDGDFVANAALESGVGGNADFFLSSLNWLLEREALMAIAPKVPDELRLDMDQGAIARTMLMMIFGFPGAAAFCGVLVWLRRRR